jgi:very-short-patch-repair endonuclease
VFRRQHSFEWFVVDFYCPAKKLVIELDGSIHDHKEIQMYDEARQKIIEEEHGVGFVRFTNQEIYSDINLVIQKIVKICL